MVTLLIATPRRRKQETGQPEPFALLIYYDAARGRRPTASGLGGAVCAQ